MAKRSATQDRYFQLVRRLPLRPIRSDKELNAAVSLIDELLDRRSLTRGERDYLDVLSDQVERYEWANHSIPRLPDAEMLRHLMEIRGISQALLARDVTMAESTVSEVLSGKRALNRAQIGKLARYFCVEPGVFDFNP